MHRYPPAVLIAFAARAAFAAGHGEETGASAMTLVTTPALEMPVSALSQRALPPLPPLASLPPPVELQPRAAVRTRNARRATRAAPHVSAPEIRLLVSEQSRDYLQEVDGQLDEALRK